MPCLWIAIRLKLRGANGSPSTRVDPGGEPRRPADLLGEDEVAGLGLAEVGDGQLAPLLLLDRPQPEALRLPGGRRRGRARCPSAASSSGGRPSRCRAPRCGRGCGRRRRAPSPCPCAPAPAAAARARPPPSARAPPRRVPLSSTSTTRSTVTLGTPPIWWKARPGAASISPSSAMSRSRALSAILSCPDRPKARAISRLPAGSSLDCDEVEDLLAARKAGARRSPGHRLISRPAGGRTWSGAGTAPPGTARRPGSHSRRPRPTRRRTPNRRPGRPCSTTVHNCRSGEPRAILRSPGRDRRPGGCSPSARRRSDASGRHRRWRRDTRAPAQRGVGRDAPSTRPAPGGSGALASAASAATFSFTTLAR